eukprot:472862-Rhodomonas_salina.5
MKLLLTSFRVSGCCHRWNSRISPGALALRQVLVHGPAIAKVRCSESSSRNGVERATSLVLFPPQSNLSSAYHPGAKSGVLRAAFSAHPDYAFITYRSCGLHWSITAHRAPSHQRRPPRQQVTCHVERHLTSFSAKPKQYHDAPTGQALTCWLSQHNRISDVGLWSEQRRLSGHVLLDLRRNLLPTLPRSRYSPTPHPPRARVSLSEFPSRGPTVNQTQARPLEPPQ